MHYNNVFDCCIYGLENKFKLVKVNLNTNPGLSYGINWYLIPS